MTNPYSDRFRRDAPWYQQAVREDEAAWTVDALAQVQELELAVFTYWLLRDEADPKGARARSELRPESRYLPEVIADLAASEALGNDFRRRLAAIASAHDWLVHGSFVSEALGGVPRAAKLRELAEAAESLAKELTEALRVHFLGLGMGENEFDRRSARARRSWPQAA